MRITSIATAYGAEFRWNFLLNLGGNEEFFPKFDWEYGIFCFNKLMRNFLNVNFCIFCQITLRNVETGHNLSKKLSIIRLVMQILPTRLYKKFRHISNESKARFCFHLSAHKAQSPKFVPNACSFLMLARS